MLYERRLRWILHFIACTRLLYALQNFTYTKGCCIMFVCEFYFWLNSSLVSFSSYSTVRDESLFRSEHPTIVTEWANFILEIFFRLIVVTRMKPHPLSLCRTVANSTLWQSFIKDLKMWNCARIKCVNVRQLKFMLSCVAHLTRQKKLCVRQLKNENRKISCWTISILSLNTTTFSPFFCLFSSRWDMREIRVDTFGMTEIRKTKQEEIHYFARDIVKLAEFDWIWWCCYFCL